MRAFCEATRSTIWRNLGHCLTCMRQAFLAFALLTAITALLFLTQAGLAAYAAALLAIGAGALSIAHLVAFALRRTGAQLARRPASEIDGAYSRRQALPLFAKSFGFAALLTALPSVALASEADCPYCSHGHCYNPATDECVCKQRDDERCCYSQTSTWRCFADQRCSNYNGDCDPA